MLLDRLDTPKQAIDKDGPAATDSFVQFGISRASTDLMGRVPVTTTMT